MKKISKFDLASGINDALIKRIGEMDDPVVSAKLFKELERIEKEESEKDNGALRPVIEVLRDPKKLIDRYEDCLFSENRSRNTIYDYCYEAGKFMKFLGEEGINYIDLDVIQKYLAYRKKKGRLSNNGFRKLVFSLKSFLKYLMKIGLVNFDLKEIKLPRRVNNKQEIVTETDFEKIKNYLAKGEEKYKNCNLRDTLIIYLLECCGLRIRELINLNWEDIDFGNWVIKIRNSKGGKSRELPFGPELGKLLKKCRKVFKNYKGAIIRGIQSRKRIHKTSLQDTIRRIYKKSGVYRKGLKNHSFRHAFATRLIREEGIHIAQQRLGHSRPDTTIIYFHPYKDDIKKGVIDFPLPEIDDFHKN